MKINRTILLTLLFSFSAIKEATAQDYQPIVEKGKHWTYECFMPLRPDEYNYTYDYWLEGDTVISGAKSIKMYKRAPQDASKQYVCSLYEENKKVYCFYPGETKTKLLYDFDCKMGDSILVESGQFKVVNIREENLRGNPIMRYDLETTIRNGNGSTEIELTWLEGVGSTKDFFSMMPWDGNYFNLKSCKKGEDVYYENSLIDVIEHISQKASKVTNHLSYDLQGRLRRCLQKGVYIRDGRKVVVK